MIKVGTSFAALFTALTAFGAEAESVNAQRNQAFEECTNTLAENGILKRGGKFAAAHLIEKDNLRIALLGTDKKGNLPNEFITSDLNSYLSFKEMTDINFYYFPDNIVDIVLESVSHWHDGKVEIVNPNQRPDITVISFSGNAEDPHGIASFPENDNFTTYGGDTSFVLVDGLKAEEPDFFNKILLGEKTDNLSEFSGWSVSEITKYVLGHELGHVFGVLHPEEALKLLNSDNPLCKEIDVEANMMFSGSEDHTKTVELGIYDIKVQKHLKEKTIAQFSPK